MKAEAQQSKFGFKRFLKIDHRAKHDKSPKQLPTPATSRSTSPSPSRLRPGPRKTGSVSSVAAPFGDDHGMEQKYGKFGKVLGVGTGGAVQVLTRPDNGQAFAVKRFRGRYAFEDEQSYIQKITSEYTIGSMVQHGNVIKTFDMIKERGQFYEVMEYAPYDLFESVRSTKLSSLETDCAFVQILRGVNHMHSLGFAHRDLKLENVVVNEEGIMKLIDFGSATVYKYPSSGQIMFAKGSVGCDPYMAPEMLAGKSYDPRVVDVWSLAMIYCCMKLHRFPWKKAHDQDPTFKRFSSIPSPHSPALNAVVATTESIETLLGPQSLLQLLPPATRAVIGGMLEVDPKRRMTFEQVLEDPWVKSIHVCSQDEDGGVYRGAGHEHTLVAGNPKIPKK